MSFNDYLLVTFHGFLIKRTNTETKHKSFVKNILAKNYDDITHFIRNQLMHNKNFREIVYYHYIINDNTSIIPFEEYIMTIDIDNIEKYFDVHIERLCDIKVV